MFKNVISYAVATSILLTSFEGMAVKGGVSSQDDPGHGKAKQALLVHQAPFQIASSSLALYDAITTSGPSFLRRSLVADLQIQYDKSGRKSSAEKLKIDRDALQKFPNSPLLYESYGDIISFAVSREDLEARIRNVENSLKEDPVTRGKLIEQCLEDPRRLVKSLQLNFKRFHDFEKAWKERIDKVSLFLDKSRDPQVWPLDVDMNMRRARSFLLHLLFEKKNVFVGGALGTLYLKSSLPFVMLCSRMMTLDPEDNIKRTIEESLIIIRRDFELNLLINNARKKIEMYNLLTFDGTLFREEMCEIYNGFVSNLDAVLREKCMENNKSFKYQDEQIQGVVDHYRQKKAEEVKRLATQMKNHEANINGPIAVKKSAEKAESKAKSRETYVAAIKQDVATREAETVRLQKQATQAVASTSSITPPKVKAPRDMSREGQLMHWYFESNENFSKRKETQQKLAILIAAQQRKADAKAAKNHETDPERAQNAASSSNSVPSSDSATEVSSASSSSSSSASSKATAPNASTEYRAILGSNHYKTLESLLTDKNSGMKMETVKALFEALGGYVDESSHRSCRVGMGLRHIDTGKAALLEVEYDGDEEEDSLSVASNSSTSSRTASTNSSSSRTASNSSITSSSSSSSSSSSIPEVRIVMHGTHARGKNGRKGLRPEQILDIREMLTNAGYTLETVISKADANTEGK